MLIDQLDRLLDDACALELWQLTDPEIREVLVASQQAIAGLQSLVARLAGAAEDRALPREDGAATTTAWLAATTGIGRAEASKIVKLSRIDAGDVTQQAWVAGALSSDQARIILTALDRLPEWFDPEQVQDAEATLLGFAGEFAAHDLRRLANRVVEVVDPDSADEIIGAQLQAQEKQAWDEAHLTFTKRGDGLTWVRGALPDVQADMLRTVLEGLSSPAGWTRCSGTSTVTTPTLSSDASTTPAAWDAPCASWSSTCPLTASPSPAASPRPSPSTSTTPTSSSASPARR